MTELWIAENLIETKLFLYSMTEQDSPMNADALTTSYNILAEKGINKGATATTLSYISDMRILGLLDKWTEVPCPDGSKALVLKDPADAFELYAKEWTTKFDVVMDMLNQIKANAEVAVAGKVVKLFDNLNYINAALQEMYKNSYLTFAATPCSESAQQEKRRMDRIIAAVGLSLVGFKVLLEDADLHKIDTINLEILKLIDRIVDLIMKN